MRYLVRTLILIALTIAVGGCASPPRLAENQTRLVIHSNPAGAVIKYKGISGVVSRPSPATIVWTLPDGTHIGSAHVLTTWPSGATTTTRLNLYAGQDSTVLMQRPDAPGLERDMQYAAAAASADANAKAEGVIFLLNAATVTMDAYSKSKQSTITRKTVNCTSEKNSDGTISTSCTEIGW